MMPEYLDAINTVRDAHGLASLGWSDECEALSLMNAKIVAKKKNKLWHPGNVKRAEIAARNQANIDEACVSWLNSPSHRKILLGEWLSVGVAMVVAVDGQPVWFAQFE